MKNQSMFVAAIFASALWTAAFAAQQPQSGSATPSGQAGQAGQTTTATSPANQSSSDKQTTLQGCLQKNKSGGYWLTMASNGASGASSATGSTSSQPGTVGTSGSTTARPTDNASASASRPGMVYNLEEMDGKVGNMDLDKHVGHKVEVTGRVDDTKSSDQLKSGSANNSAPAPAASATNSDRETDAQDFHIASIRMIEGNCN